MFFFCSMACFSSSMVMGLLYFRLSVVLCVEILVLLSGSLIC